MAKVEKEHLIFAIRSLMTVVSASIASQTLQRDMVKSIQDRGSELLKKIEGETIEVGAAGKEVKKLIADVNKLFPKLHSPFPPFATDYVENQVKNNVIAFEMFLNYKLKSHHLTLEQEGPLFSDSLVLWRDVGRKLSAKEGIGQLAKLIQKANSFLTDDEKFPIPDQTKY